MIPLTSPQNDAPHSDDTRQTTRRALRNAFGQFATGVTVVTTHSPRGPVGITANSFSSVSLEPALVSWAINSASARYPAFAQARAMSIHILAEDQHALCQAFAHNAEAFDLFAWQKGEFDTPQLEGVLARFDVCPINEFAAGDHRIFIAQIQNFTVHDGKPLIFHGGQFQSLTKQGLTKK